MHEAFNALFEFDECAVIHHADNLALELAAGRIAIGCVDPGIFRQLLETERNALLVPVEL